jgi:hypothetical protein
MRLFIVLTALLVCSASALAQDAAKSKVEMINLMGRDYTVSRELPEEILGEYLYEGEKEPIVLIRNDGTGIFQPHMSAKIPIKIWIDVEENGKPRIERGTELRYRYTPLIQYGPGGGNYKQDAYDLLDVTMLKDEGKAMILGERIKKF